MNLSFDTIKELTHGVSYISKNNEDIQFHRFNKGEEEYYKKSPWQRHYTTSGVKLVFSTDSTKLKLKVNVEEATPSRFFSHDVFCNGKCIGYIRNFTDKDLPIKFDEKWSAIGDFKLGVFEAEFDLGEGLKEISIVFPWSVKSMLQELIIDDSANIYPLKKEYKMIAYGDSITYGAYSFSPSNRYIAKVAETLGVEEVCKAVGGEKFCPRLLNSAEEKDVKLVTVAYGTNDSRIDFEVFKTRCDSFFEKISTLYSETPIFVISPIWRKANENPEQLAKMNNVKNHIEKTVSQYKNIIFIDGSNLVPANEAFFADGCLHPNDDGFEHYYKNLINILQKHL